MLCVFLRGFVRDRESMSSVVRCGGIYVVM